MAKGRKPVPTRVKVLRGNPGKRPLNPQEPEFLDTPISCPSELSARAKREWERMYGQLTISGVLKSVDRALLAAYCQAWAQWIEAVDIVAKTGAVIKTSRGAAVINPYLRVLDKAFKHMRACLVEMGVTPSERSRLRVGDPGEDALGKFLNGNQK